MWIAADPAIEDIPDHEWGMLRSAVPIEPQSTEMVVAEPVVFSSTPTPAPAAIPNATAEPTVTGIAVYQPPEP